MAIGLLSVALALSIVFAGWLAFHLLAQNGRMLERLERLESAREANRRQQNRDKAASEPPERFPP